MCIAYVLVATYVCICRLVEVKDKVPFSPNTTAKSCLRLSHVCKLKRVGEGRRYESWRLSFLYVCSPLLCIPPLVSHIHPSMYFLHSLPFPLTLTPGLVGSLVYRVVGLVSLAYVDRRRGVIILLRIRNPVVAEKEWKMRFPGVVILMNS